MALGVRFVLPLESIIDCFEDEYLTLAREAVRALQYVQRLNLRGSQYDPDVRSMTGQNWHLLGTGHYGIAMYHEDYPELALKVSGRAGWGASEYSVADDEHYPRLDAWPVFAQHCWKNPHPNLPDILHFERLSQSCAWAVMPRYEEYLKGKATDYREFSEEYSNFRKSLSGEWPCPEWLWPLRQMADSLRFEVDLHSGNVMRDSKGRCVIIDPFSTCGASHDNSALCTINEDERIYATA